MDSSSTHTQPPLDEIVTLAQDLIKIPSVSGGIEKSVEVLKYIETYLEGLHFVAFAPAGIPSLLYSNKAIDEKKFKIILNAHLDVVPAKSEQFIPFVKNGRMYGRGAYDMKAATAVFIQLFKDIADKVSYPLALQLTTDEEIGGIDGTKHQIDKDIRGDFVITGECGSNFRIVHESKARLVVRLIGHGKTSHSAYPWLGDNAILRIQRAVHEIMKEYPIPVEPTYITTVNITHISTNNVERTFTGYNRTPNYCEALLDIRYVPDDKDTIIQKIKSLISDHVSMEVLHNSTPHQTDKSNMYIKKLQEVTKGVIGRDVPLIQQHATSDVRHYSSVNVAGVEFGPIGENQHVDNEWVDIQSLADYYQILKTFLLSIN